VISDILTKIDLDYLINAIGSQKLEQIKKLADSKNNNSLTNRDDVLMCIIAYYGYDLLSNKRIRQLIFYTIDQNKLKYFTNKYCKKIYTKAYDNALELSLLPWKSNSEFVVEISDNLDLPNYYLPCETDTLPNRIEIEQLPKYYPLYDYQEELKNEILLELNSRNNRFLVQMPTGSGKTRTVLESTISYIHNANLVLEGKIVLWLAHTEELCEQAIDTFSKLWPHLSDYPITIHRAYGDHTLFLSDERGCFIVGTLQKFSSLFKNDSYLLKTIKDSLKILIIDEAHKAIAKTYSSLINFLTIDDVKLIGITATPGRAAEKFEENIELAKFFNKKLLTPNFSENPIIELRNKGILSFLKRKIIDSNIDIVLNEKESQQSKIIEDISSLTLKNLANNLSRNKLIIKILEEEINKNNPCLVFTCNVNHAQILNAAMNFKNYSTLSLDSNTGKSRRKIIIEEFKTGKCQILFNYGILSTGFDAPNIRTVIITRPTSSIVLYSQMIGRGLRGPKMGGAKECNLIEIRDNFKNFGGVEKVYHYFEDYWKN